MCVWEEKVVGYDECTANMLWKNMLDGAIRNTRGKLMTNKMMLLEEEGLRCLCRRDDGRSIDVVPSDFRRHLLSNTDRKGGDLLMNVHEERVR